MTARQWPKSLTYRGYSRPSPLTRTSPSHHLPSRDLARRVSTPLVRGPKFSGKWHSFDRQWQIQLVTEQITRIDRVPAMVNGQHCRPPLSRHVATLCNSCKVGEWLLLLKNPQNWLVYRTQRFRSSAWQRSFQRASGQVRAEDISDAFNQLAEEFLGTHPNPADPDRKIYS